MMPIEAYAAPGATSVYIVSTTCSLCLGVPRPFDSIDRSKHGEATHRGRHQAQKHLSPFGLDQMQENGKRDKHRHDQRHDEQLEKHHALPATAVVEKDENDEHVGSGDDDAAPEWQGGEESV